MTCHGLSPDRAAAFELQDAIAFRLADAIISPSRHWAERLQRDYEVCDVDVVPYGLDLHRYPLLEARAEFQAPVLRVLILSELTHRKGIDVLLDAIPTVLRAFPNVEFHFWGKGDSAELYRSRALAMSEASGRLFFPGFMQDPYPRLAEFDLLCLPTLSDNLPLSIMEAMLAGLPVLSTRVGGIPELLGQSGCGDLVDPGSAGALAKAMVGLLNLGRPALRLLGRKGRDRARDAFAIVPAVDRLEALYIRAGGKATNGRR
jgi:glycosyltransferase involved in cell wall biosynthesis